MKLAFGLRPLIRTWAASRGAGHLMATGGRRFQTALADALADPENEFLWQMQGIDLRITLNSAGFFANGDLDRCQYTNWELFTFLERPELWERTTWWLGDDEQENPLEQLL